MMRFKSSELPLLIPLTLLLGAVITQADANWSHAKNAGINRNVGSAAHPTQEDLVLVPGRLQA